METVRSPAEQRVLLRNVSWETYERLLAEKEERRVPRFFYDRGVLEIVSPSMKHEALSRAVAMVVAVFAEASGVDVYGAGSTTFNREDLERGFEPDECFYVQNEERMRGKEEVDLNVDPPPDLVIEVDVTSPSLDKFSVYARIGVPEVWRHDGEGLTFFGLEGGRYAAIPVSAVLPPLTAEVVSRFVRESTSAGSATWLRRVREWARGPRA